MSKISGVATVWLPVTDLQRSVDFYSEKLGLRATQQESDWAELESDGLKIGLNANETPHGEGGAVIAFRADDELENAVQELRAEGVKFTADISDHPWGRLATFADPDGNPLQLYSPPA